VSAVPRLTVDGLIECDWDLRREAGGSACMSRSSGGAEIVAALLSAAGCAADASRTVPADLLPGDPRARHAYRLWSDHDGAWRADESLGGVTAPISVSPAPIGSDGPLPGWAVLQTAAAVAPGASLEPVAEAIERMVVVLDVADLRAGDIQVSRELSWERAAQDVAWEIVHDPAVNVLSRAAGTVVLFGLAGAVVVTGEDRTLVFDPESIEGTWEEAHPGTVPGVREVITAAVARVMARDGVEGLGDAVRHGLHAARVLHAQGWQRSVEGALVLPAAAVVAALEDEPTPFATVPIEDPTAHLEASTPGTGGRGSWSILRDRHPGDLEELARRIVVEGPARAVRDVPIGRFGALLTLDRQEIEGFRSIRSLVREHRERGDRKPLSIAVFGAPGSGKSFGVTQVASSLLPGQIEVLEFNLAQLGSPADLIHALHRVRDVGIAGRVPLVFWDEFDTALDGRPLGWLRYFLAPMQDGRFQEGEVVHPIPPSIFVFAGGTAHRMSSFGSDLDPLTFRGAKGPDFVSRLRGFVDVLGPNPQPQPAAGSDQWSVVRRAVLIRSMLERAAPQLFHQRDGGALLSIDPGVLRALLGVPEFRHGARSIEAVISMSRVNGATSFERSCLPTERQLDLHVDGTAFLALVQRLELHGAVLETLAEAAHDAYREGCRARGETTDATQVRYADLEEDGKEQNRSSVRDIADKLDRAGYVMVPARSDEPAFTFPGDALEGLARAEHERWARTAESSGWRKGDVRDVAARTHPDLVEWDELPESERQKDRDLVMGIPAILARAGYAIVATGSN